MFFLLNLFKSSVKSSVASSFIEVILWIPPLLLVLSVLIILLSLASDTYNFLGSSAEGLFTLLLIIRYSIYLKPYSYGHSISTCSTAYASSPHSHVSSSM